MTSTHPPASLWRTQKSPALKLWYILGTANNNRTYTANSYNTDQITAGDRQLHARMPVFDLTAIETMLVRCSFATVSYGMPLSTYRVDCNA